MKNETDGNNFDGKKSQGLIWNQRSANRDLRIDFAFSQITLSNFFVKFENQNFPSLRIFVKP